MTITAPSSRPVERRGELAAPLGLAPPSGVRVEVSDAPRGLSGTARLGAALLLIIGLLIQRTVLPLVPWGPADLVTAMVAVLALYGGPTVGCISGFGIGLAADAMSDHALGRLAAVLCVIGYVCGLLPSYGRYRFWLAYLTIAGASVLTPLIFALTGAFAGDDRAAGGLLITRCLVGLCYGLVMAPFVYALIARLLAPHTRRAYKRRPGRLPRITP